ncbi:hypothetical protein JKF63_03578 [Porcisia hertigi]|uniref:Uncharacterized protein n=1 Tax=Porcisia hertigi TaxID=2761500 RepID=A0A836HZZ7_9TRYP|nr:hypothetical protein JKF63_03578 [Porcisia hertigi]
MDVPLRLRLAYANCFGDVYCDRKLVRCDAHPLSHGLLYVGKDSQRENQPWLSSLVASVEAKQPKEVLPHAAPAVDASLCTPSLATALVESRAPSSSPSTGSPREHFFVHSEALERPPRSPDDISATPQLPASESARNEEQLETPHSPIHSLNKTAPSPPVSSLEPRKQGRKGVEAADQANVVAEGQDEAVTRQHAVRLSEELAGAHETLYADVTATLERRLRECVLKTVALDSARQQLICAFQLQPSTSPAPLSPHPHSLPPMPSAVTTLHSGATPQPQGHLTRQDAASGERADAPAEAPVTRAAATDAGAPLPWLSANRTDASLSNEVRKEMALHLYALRRQVQQLRHQLEAHESTHYRHVNALRAAYQKRHTSSSPPLRVEIVKAYEEDPVPYRKGPWREADFAAARRDGPGRGTGAVKGDALGDENYTSDDFTEVTPAASSVVDTEGGQISDESSSSSSVSSTEELLRQQRAAAIRRRNQQAAARSSAANAASSFRKRRSGRSVDHSISSTNTITTTDTDKSSTRTTVTTTSTDNDTDSDS